MKTRLPIYSGFCLLSCIFLLSLTCCNGRPKRLRPYGWLSTGYRSDLLLSRLDSLVYNYSEADSIVSLAEEYCRMLDVEDLSGLYLHRRLYWEGTALFMRGEFEKGDSLRRLAMIQCDSSRFPHDYLVYRFSIEQPTDFSDNAERYLRYISDLNSFIEFEDLANGFSRAVQLSQLMSEAGMHERALKYALMADSLLYVAGLPLLRSNNMANIATCMFNAGDTVGAVRTLAGLKERMGDKIPSVEAIVNFNIFQMNGDSTALQKAWKIVREEPDLLRMRPLVAAAMVKKDETLGDADMAEYVRILDDESEYSYRAEEQLYVKEAQCEVALRGKDINSITGAFKEYKAAVGQYLKEQRRGELVSAAIAAEINDVEKEAEKRHRRSIQMFWLLLSLSVITGGVITIVLLIRINKLRQLELLAQIEVEQEKRRRITSGVEGEGKKLPYFPTPDGSPERYDTSISGDDNKIPEVTTTGMEDQYFTAEFMKLYPKVGKNGRRLAAYISKGFDTVTIAKEMNIRKESVMQARWRLRKQMDLPPEEDLEAAVFKVLRQL